MIYTIGETVLDIIFKDNQPFSAKAGGSVLNSSVSLGRLGVNVSFISDYGSDKVGELIDGFLRDNHVDTSHVVRFNQHKSALAMAFLDENNDASYTFYKDFPEKRLEGLNVHFTVKDYLLFGSFFAITDSVRGSLLELLNKARRAGATIIYDPNFRKPHLHELQKVKPWIIENMSFADIVKGSDEDFNLIFNVSDPEEAYIKVKESGCNYFLYTAGSRNVSLLTPKSNIQIKVPSINPVSTIGAGDNFNAGIVYSLYRMRIHKNDILGIGNEEWKQIAQTGVRFASDVCLHYDNYISSELVKEIMAEHS
jgi:fructokinase